MRVGFPPIRLIQIGFYLYASSSNSATSESGFTGGSAPAGLWVSTMAFGAYFTATFGLRISTLALRTWFA